MADGTTFKNPFDYEIADWFVLDGFPENLVG
jgi:hypothetical protein